MSGDLSPPTLFDAFGYTQRGLYPRRNPPEPGLSCGEKTIVSLSVESTPNRYGKKGKSHRPPPSSRDWEVTTAGEQRGRKDLRRHKWPEEMKAAACLLLYPRLSALVQAVFMWTGAAARARRRPRGAAARAWRPLNLPITGVPLLFKAAC